MIESFTTFLSNHEREIMLINTQAIVLAAGKSTRFNTGNSKLLEKVCGQQIILYPLTALQELNIPTTLVVGFQKNNIKRAVETQYPASVSYIEQHEINGTAGALKTLKEKFKSKTILIMKGDVPLIKASLIEKLYEHHQKTDSDISFISAHNGDPTGFSYSRVVKKEGIISIRKAQELTYDEIQEHCCINSGIYLFSRTVLEDELPHLKKNSITGEFHLSDLINKAAEKNYKVSTLAASFDQIRGVNNHQELWAIEQIKRAELIKYWMDRGVRFSSAQTVHMDLDVEIGAGTFVGCSVHLLHGTKIGSYCTISPFSIIETTTIGDYSTIHPHSILRHATIGARSEIGPFAHIQQDSTIGDHCIIGNFVETKRITMGNNSKAKHLTYLGDARIGSQVNIGAGTITCNFDGKTKHTTEIKDNVFVGTNNSLVAPLVIEEHAFTAAGSTITDHVPAQSLAIARARQQNKENFVKINAQDNAIDKSQEPKESVSFVGAYKTHTDASTKDQ